MSLPSLNKVITYLLTYCAFHKHANSEVQKSTDVCVFRCHNILSGPLRKQTFTSMGSKGHGLWFVIGGFRSVLCIFLSLVPSRPRLFRMSLSGKFAEDYRTRFQASSGNSDSANWPGYEAVYFCDSRSLLVIGIMIDGSELWLTAAKNLIVKAAFELQSLRVFEKRSDSVPVYRK